MSGAAPPQIVIGSVPDGDALASDLEGLLRGYIDWTAGRVLESTGVAIDPDAYVSATLDNIAAYLPPRGRLLLARGGEGALLGMVFVKIVRPETAEIKRLYVSPEARGLGLGRRLADEAIAAARALGAKRVLLDTGRWMTAALALYRDLGFQETPPYPESENDAALAPHLVYMELALAG